MEYLILDTDTELYIIMGTDFVCGILSFTGLKN